MLGIRIACLRKKNGYTQSALAGLLHISPSALGMYEQGRRIPGVQMLLRMSELLDVSLDYLLTGREFSQRGSNTCHVIAERCNHYCCRFCCIDTKNFSTISDAEKLFWRNQT